ncbi:MAG TPA: SPFH domain-containing protein [Terracidiphilus sp.]|nr:SPFH domain-containing protein [Terracidiphilus sp.]
MLALKLLLNLTGILFLAAAAAIPLYWLVKRILYLREKARRAQLPGDETATLHPLAVPDDLDWRGSVALVMVACLPMLVAASIVVVPAGMGGVLVSQISGTVPGTLCPGLHFVTPLVDSVQTFDLRDHVFNAGILDEGVKNQANKHVLDVQSREGLDIGLGVTVRYRLDPNQLSSIQAHLPQPADQQLVPPVVASAWRQLAPEYTVREIFSTKREEIRSLAAAIITRKLAADGIDVEEVMLSDIQLPPQYAQGLEGLLLKEQQYDQMGVLTDIQQKQVRIAELQAEAEAAQKVKQAEGDAQARVVEAKGESDAMQYTLPLKEKQIEQSKLEAEARKEATIENAQADAQAKVIDSQAEEQRRDMLAQAEANRIKLLAAADATQMASEGALLNKSPLLIDKIIAEKLSDKIRLVMVPNDGKYFFADDIFKGLEASPAAQQQMGNTQDPDTPSSH